MKTDTGGKSGPKLYYPAIDVIRFLCATMVVLFHLGFSSWFKELGGHFHLVHGSYRIWQGILFWWGTIGVYIFFVISGFVIAASANGASPLSFLRSRVERLYPAVWICSSISLVAWIALSGMDTGRLLMLYAKNLMIFPRRPWLDGVLWTMVVEIGFYSYIFVLLLLDRSRHFGLFACAIIASCVPYSLFNLLAGLDVVAHNPVRRLVVGPLAMIPIMYGSYFGLGMLLWLRRVGHLPRFGRAFIALAVIQVLVTQLPHHYLTAQEYAAHVPWIGHSWPVACLVWLAACWAIAEARPVAVATGDGMTGSYRLVRTLGLATYPLYLVHYAAGVGIIRFLVAHGVPPLLAGLLALVLLVLASCVIATRGEPVLRRIIRAGFEWLFRPGWLPDRLRRRTAPIVASDLVAAPLRA